MAVSQSRGQAHSLAADTFVARAMRDYRRKVALGFRKALAFSWNACRTLESGAETVQLWAADRVWKFLLCVGAAFWLGTLWLPSVFDFLGGFNLVLRGVLSLFASELLAAVLLICLLVAPRIALAGASLVSLPVALSWASLYALWQSAKVAGKLLLLLPLSLLYMGTRLAQLWNGIFYTCPGRDCQHRGIPRYVCSCGAVNACLWPSLHGLLWHPCSGCGRQMPTLELLGRNDLQKLCGGCGMPLNGKHAGSARERLVGLAGAPSSGKTNYLLMAVNEILHPKEEERIRGVIDDATQESQFLQSWRDLQNGRPADKTASVPRAFLMYAQTGSERMQLYLYDAPGEEFTSIGLTERRYFTLLEGLIIMVDPLCFEPVRAQLRAGTISAVSLSKVVASTIEAASQGERTRNGKLRYRVAVVISKADLKPVKDRIGDVGAGGIPEWSAAKRFWNGEAR